MTMVPRTRFMFYANFMVNPAPLNVDNSFLSKLGTWQDGISFKIKTIDKPKIDLTTTEMNQYNRRRYAYTKVEYLPFTIKLHDTVDNKVLKLWREYFTYYFADSRTKSSTDMSSGTVDPTFTDSSGWGLRPIGEDTSFFSRIELYSLFGTQYTQTTYLNPRITAVDWEQNDSTSADPEEVSITFRYEAIEYKDPTTLSSSDATRFGFGTDIGDGGPNEVETGIGATVPINNSTYTVATQTSSNTGLAAAYAAANNPIPASQVIANPQQGPIDGIPGGNLPTQTGSISGTNGVISNTQSPVNSSIAAVGSFTYGPTQVA